MACLTRDVILAALAPKLHQVPTPEFGDGAFVLIREFDGKTRQDFADSVGENCTNGELYRAAFAFGVTDDSGVPLFSRADLPRLASLVPELIDRIGQKVVELNATNRKSLDDAKKP